MVYLTLAEAAEAADRIVAVCESASPAQRAAGLAWYPEARRFCQAIGRASAYTTERTAAIVAVLSPQLGWALNKAGAAAIVSGRRASVGFYANRIKAEAIASGADIESHLGRYRVKVWHFWRAILGDPDSVTLDRWALRAMLGREATDREANRLDRPGGYAEYAACYRAAADRLGITAAECQAIAWVVVRGAAE